MEIWNTIRDSSGLQWIIVLILGLLFGSFLNVVIYRLPRMLMHQWKEDCQNFLNEANWIP